MAYKVLRALKVNFVISLGSKCGSWWNNVKTLGWWFRWGLKMSKHLSRQKLDGRIIRLDAFIECLLIFFHLMQIKTVN